jgi:hypothetical protein
VSSLDEIGERDAWRCWVCDLPVNQDASVNDTLGPSIDRCEVFVKASGRKKSDTNDERLAHRGCNTKKGAVKPVIAWPSHLILFDPAPIVQSAERLLGKGGRELVARCATKADAKEAATWIQDRLSRLIPGTVFTTQVDEGGGQFLLSVVAPRR